MNQLQLNHTLTCAQVSLRRFSSEMLAEFWQIVTSERKRLGSFLPVIEFLQKESDLAEYLKYRIEKWDTMTAYFYALHANAENKIIGSVNVDQIDWHNERAELSYWISSDYEGRGFITQGVMLLEEELRSIGIHRIEVQCVPDNTRSIKLLEKLGYTFEAQLKERFKFHNQFKDLNMYSKIL
jgi:RimJ/RimL family protein N-acetyltransferase